MKLPANGGRKLEVRELTTPNRTGKPDPFHREFSRGNYSKSFHQRCFRKATRFISPSLSPKHGTPITPEKGKGFSTIDRRGN